MNRYITVLDNTHIETRNNFNKRIDKCKTLKQKKERIIKEMESIFVELGNNLIPFFIEKSLLQKGNQLRVQFEGMNSEEEADSILKSSVYLPIDLLPKLTGEKFYFHEVIGFQIVDVNYGEVGVIVGINDKTAQPLFEIKNGDTEVLIPMIDDFIKKVDRENQVIEVETPAGLIEMYLS